MRRASESKIPIRYLPYGSGDVGLHEAAGPVHEVQEGLALHPRGHRAALEARGGAAVWMDRRSATKEVTVPVPGGHRRPGQPSRLPMAVGLAIRPRAAV